MTDCHKYLTENWALLQQADLLLPRPNPTFHNPAFEAAGFRVLILRLSPSRDVDRSTPHLFLYRAVRRAEADAYVDMAFFPPEHDRKRLLEAGVPLLFGVQSFRPAEDFDLVLVSNAYTLELINLPYLLLNSGIPVMASDRDERWPIFILGGSNALAIQAVVTPEGDSVADAHFFGEGEGAVETLVRLLRECAGEGKRDRLARAAGAVTGLWVANADFEQQVEQALYSAPTGEQLLVDFPRLNGSEAATARLQITYGCPAFCSFCFEGYERKPYREVPLPDILEAARRLKRDQGAQKLELYSFNFNTHADIFTLLIDLNRLFDRVSVKSQRVDLLYDTPGLIEAEVAADKRNFTLGIEGVSERLRAFLHKSLDTEAIMGVLAALLREKIRELKLFYILTGHETQADIQEFRDFLLDLKALRQRTNPGVRIVFSVGRLVRMPFTPLRYDRLFLDEEAWRPIVGMVKSACETNTFEFRLATEWEEYAASQVLALAGHWLHEIVIALAEEGHCYDTGLPAGYWEALRSWMEAEGYWNETFLGEKPRDYAFPMDFVETRIGDDFLFCRYEEARQGVDTGYCLGSAGRSARCLGCGACVLPEQRRALIQHRMRRPEGNDYWRRLPALMHTKWRHVPIYARVRVPPVAANVHPEWLNAWAMRRLLNDYPELLDNLLSVEEALFTVGENADRLAGLYGETVFALEAWDTDDVIWELTAPEATSAQEGGFLEFLPGFEPGIFRQLQMTLTLPLDRFPNAGRRLRDFLRESYVPVNVRREGRRYHFDLSRKALKKRVLLGGSYMQDEENFVASLQVGPKFDLVGFLRSFGDHGRYREGRAEVTQIDI